MICSPCRTGGAWNRAWRESRLDTALSISAGFHAKCAGDCCCQHAIGIDSLVVNP